MITFRKFLVEKIVGNTGWVYHRTKNNPEGSEIITHGIKPSSNQSAMYGKGLYCCYDINQQLKPDMRKYGAYILKGKIDLNSFAILDEDIYRLANPRGNFQKHLREIGTNMESVQDTIPYTSRIAQNIWKKCKANGYNGIIFTGENDGKVAVIWNRRNFIPYQYTKDDGKSWEKLNPDISSIKRKEDPEYDKDDEVIKFSKILRELSNKEEIGDLKSPHDYIGIVFLKNLKKSGNIDIHMAAEINLPQLQTSGDIGGQFAAVINLPQLQTSGHIDAPDVKELNLPQLQKSKDIYAYKATELNLTQLQTSGHIYVYKATELNLPQLQTSGHIDALGATVIDLPQLQKCGGIDARSATVINLPQLQKCSGIYAPSAKKIIIPKHLKYECNNVPSDCEIIHPEETPEIKVNENVTFKKYLKLKERFDLLTEWKRELMPDIYAALEKYDDPMVGVHFSKGVGTDENKKTPHIGLNMQPFHHDPIGIYAFPKDYVLSGKLERNAGFRELVDYYIVKPSAKANILNLSTMSEQDAIDILKKMGIGENVYRQKTIYHNSGKSEVGHRFWGTLEVMRKQIYGEMSKNVSWNNLFKKTGYNVLYDDGDGIIHSNEPTQIVYLNSSAMEILDKGTQDDPKNKIYSFLIKQFPELRPKKTTDHWTYKILKLSSDKGYDLIIHIMDGTLDGYSKIRVSIKDQISGKSKPLDEFEMRENMEESVKRLKEKLAKVEGEYTVQGEKEVNPVLEDISKRFNIKLKKDDEGNWEIRQKYQDADKDYVITFYVRPHKDEMFFVLNKKQKSKNYNTFGYNEAALIKYRERNTPEEIVDMGLKELEYQRYGSISVNHSAMKTIEFLRKRVFGL